MICKGAKTRLHSFVRNEMFLIVRSYPLKILIVPSCVNGCTKTPMEIVINSSPFALDFLIFSFDLNLAMEIVFCLQKFLYFHTCLELIASCTPFGAVLHVEQFLSYTVIQKNFLSGQNKPIALRFSIINFHSR